MKTAREPYVTLKSFPHYGESAVILKVSNGVIHGWMLNCKHGVTKLDIIRADI